VSIEFQLIKETLEELRALREGQRKNFCLLEEFMSSTNQGLAGAQASLSKLETSNAKLVQDVATLLANQQAGPQPGQVVVQQADIDAVQARIDALTSADTTADGTVNPAPPATT
jgi:hypothetical protein